MAHKTRVGGTAYEIKGGRTLVGGTGYGISKGHTLLSGTGYDINFVAGGTLGTLAEGSIILLNENGSPVEFYVAKHNYEPSLNGNGRTLVVRKDCHSDRSWHSAKVNAYASSDIDVWLNGEYKALLDADIQNEIGTTTFYYTPGNGNSVMATLARPVFLLSVGELVGRDGWCNTEGSVLPIAKILQVCYKNGSSVIQWTRSPNLTDASNAEAVCVKDGVTLSYRANFSVPCSRPVFTLPSTLLVDADGYVSVAT